MKDSPVPRGTWAAFVALVLATGGCKPPVEQVQWPVMGTIAAVKARGRDAARLHAAAAATRETFAEIERLLNAHAPGSALSKAARLDERALVEDPAVEPCVRSCCQAAFALMHATDGAFNPRWRGPGTLDLGAIAKGFAVDQAAGKPPFADGADRLIDLGGNLKAVRGKWKAGVKNPLGPGFAASVELDAGESLATSATYYRGNHICDGRTGLAVSNGVASVTVLCDSALWADGLSTALFILGPQEGRDLLANLRSNLLVDAQALWVLDDGSLVPSGEKSRFALLAPGRRVGDKPRDRR